MSYKTDRLVDLFADAYAANEKASLIHKLLDAFGAELMQADEDIKRLLKSHWVNYASGEALDGLGSIYGVTRRRLPDPDRTQETDEAFRMRLKSIVPLFTGGGTRRAVLGAVRSALGFPFDLAQLNLPDDLDGLLWDLENLITLVEFSPHAEQWGKATDEPGILTLEVPVTSVRAERPRIEWTFGSGGGRRLRLERLDTGAGIIADDDLLVPEGQTLMLSARSNGRLSAFVDDVDVSGSFQSLGGGDPVLPEVPRFPSQWRFTAFGALLDVSVFDKHDTFDRPSFRVEMTWHSFEPLSFDVVVPYFLKGAVENLQAQHGYAGDIFVYEGLDLETIQQVVDQTRAAGVRGNVHFSLNFSENHQLTETLAIAGDHRHSEYANASDALTMGSVAQLAESHDVAARFGLGGVFDVARFDGDFVFT